MVLTSEFSGVASASVFRWNVEGKKPNLMGPLEGTTLTTELRWALPISWGMYNFSEAKIKIAVSVDDNKDSLHKTLRPVPNTDNVQCPE
jgi:hypothetical protein